MIRILINNWWLLLLRGMCALAFAGFVIFVQPFFPTVILRPWASSSVVVIFALLAISMGVITVFASIRGAENDYHAWLMLAEGLSLTAVGLVVLLVPRLLLWEVIKIIGGSALLIGGLEIATGIHLRRHITDEWLLLLGGASSVFFGLYLLSEVTPDVSSVLKWIALYAFVNGAAIVVLAFRLRALRHSVHALAAGEKLAASHSG